MASDANQCTIKQVVCHCLHYLIYDGLSFDSKRIAIEDGDRVRRIVHLNCGSICMKATVFFFGSMAIAALVGSLGLGVASPARLYAHETEHRMGHGSHHPQGSSTPGHEHHHSHEQLEILPGQPVPGVNLIVHEDAMRGWNLEIQVENFRFAPENINQANNPGEGHGHLYINGEKITRIYGNWYYLPSLEPGEHEITVTLNSNGHEELVYNGQVIQDSETITVSAHH